MNKYYYEKYIKYKLKYLSLGGGPKTEVSLGPKTEVSLAIIFYDESDKILFWMRPGSNMSCKYLFKKLLEMNFYYFKLLCNDICIFSSTYNPSTDVIQPPVYYDYEYNESEKQWENHESKINSLQIMSILLEKANPEIDKLPTLAQVKQLKKRIQGIEDVQFIKVTVINDELNIYKMYKTYFEENAEREETMIRELPHNKMSLLTDRDYHLFPSIRVRLLNVESTNALIDLVENLRVKLNKIYEQHGITKGRRLWEYYYDILHNELCNSNHRIAEISRIVKHYPEMKDKLSESIKNLMAESELGKLCQERGFVKPAETTPRTGERYLEHSTSHFDDKHDSKKASGQSSRFLEDTYESNEDSETSSSHLEEDYGSNEAVLRFDVVEPGKLEKPKEVEEQGKLEEETRKSLGSEIIFRHSETNEILLELSEDKIMEDAINEILQHVHYYFNLICEGKNIYMSILGKDRLSSKIMCEYRWNPKTEQYQKFVDLDKKSSIKAYIIRSLGVVKSEKSIEVFVFNDNDYAFDIYETYFNHDLENLTLTDPRCTTRSFLLLPPQKLPPKKIDKLLTVEHTEHLISIVELKKLSIDELESASNKLKRDAIENYYKILLRELCNSDTRVKQINDIYKASKILTLELYLNMELVEKLFMRELKCITMVSGKEICTIPLDKLYRISPDHKHVYTSSLLTSLPLFTFKMLIEKLKESDYYYCKIFYDNILLFTTAFDIQKETIDKGTLSTLTETLYPLREYEYEYNVGPNNWNKHDYWYNLSVIDTIISQCKPPLEKHIELTIMQTDYEIYDIYETYFNNILVELQKLELKENIRSSDLAGVLILTEYVLRNNQNKFLKDNDKINDLINIVNDIKQAIKRIIERIDPPVDPPVDPPMAIYYYAKYYEILLKEVCTSKDNLEPIIRILEQYRQGKKIITNPEIISALALIEKKS